MPEPFLSIVIPAYNEAPRIGEALEKIRRYVESKNFLAELVVVDDGSTDRTAEVSREHLATFPLSRLVSNAGNRGKGFSVRRGVLEAQGEYVLFTDADLSTPIEEADRLLEVIETSGADAVVGSRALRRELIGVHQPWWRELAGIFFNLLVRLITGLRLRDTQCGFKLFRHSTYRAFQSQRVEGFGFDPEVLFLIQRWGGKVVEVPVRWNDSRASKVRFLRDSTQMFLDLIAIRWRALRGQYHQ